MNRLSVAVVAIAGAVAVLLSAAGCAAAPAVAGTSVGPSEEAGQDTASWLARGGCRALVGNGSEQTAVAPANETSTGSASNAGPAATEGTLLTVTGDFEGTANRTVELSMSMLDAMPQVACSVLDQDAEGRQVEFEGVLLATVLSSINAQPVTTLHTLAANDYAVDLPVTDIEQYPVLLATRLEGEPMSVAHYGPLRVVYPTVGFQLDPTVYNPRWIWQLTTIDVG